MDIFILMMWIVVIYIFYLLIETISSLRDEIKEMRQKCVKSVGKDKMETDIKTRDPKKELNEKFKMITGYIKSFM